MLTQCKAFSFAFQGCQRRRVTAAFDGGSITSNAGALLLRQADRSTGLFDRVAAGFTDHRDPRLTEHSVRTMVAQRITGIALGYDDLNDHDDLRRDPLLALLAGKLEARRKGCAPLAGKSTLSRLEHAPAGGKPSRYAKIDHDSEKLQDVLVESFIDSWQGLPPSRLVLDIDSTDVAVHGRQEGRFYHGYYNHYCFLPLYITCGGRPLFALLRPGNADPAGGVTGPLGPHRRPAPPGVSPAGPVSAASWRRPSIWRTRRTPASWSPRCLPTPSRRGPSTSASTAHGATWENTIKEQQLDLFSDRTSATCFAANQLRLLFSAFASILFDALRQALHGTRLARATAGTLRLKLLKIGARVMVSVRRVKVAMDSAHPSAAAFARVHARLPG